MMNFNNLFNMQGMMFALMILGLFLRKREIITDKNKGLLTDLVIDVTLPCSIIKSFEMDFDAEVLKSCLVIFLVAIAIQIGTYLLGLVLYPHCETRRKKVLQYATICSNAGILGNPIAEGVFGSVGLLYASLYLIPQRCFMWSLGLTYFTECPDKKSLVKKVLTHPCIIAVFIGLPMMIFQITLPGVVRQTVHTLAGANTAVSMLLIGSILAGQKLRGLWDRMTIYYAFVRLMLIPFLVWLPCFLLGLEPLVTGVAVVLAGMPAASVTAILAAKHDCDAIFAARCVVSSTLLSMLTVPLWCIFLG